MEAASSPKPRPQKCPPQNPPPQILAVPAHGISAAQGLQQRVTLPNEGPGTRAGIESGIFPIIAVGKSVNAKVSAWP